MAAAVRWTRGQELAKAIGRTASPSTVAMQSQRCRDTVGLLDDYWIKSLGMGAREQQLPDDWGSVDDGLFRRALTSAVKPGMRPGHGIVYYASGTGLVFAVGVITSFPYRFDDPDQPDWPWRVNVELTAWRDFIHDGLPLEALNVAGRDLRQSIKRRSHIRLRPREYAEAARRLS